MVGVVATESGGKTDAVQPGGMGRGLVSIDLGEHPDVTEAQAFDPQFAMSWALAHSGGDPAKLGAPLFFGPRDHPQTASDAKKQVMGANPEAKAAGADTRSTWQKVFDALPLKPFGVTSSDIQNAPGPTVPDIAGFLSSVAHAAAWLSSAHNWLRVAEVVIGAALVLAGLWRLSPGLTEPVKGVAKRSAELVAVA